nr:EAL domain-containing protein [Wenzhouxiangella limi]
MQRVADQGTALDTALDDALSRRQQAIARETTWVGALLAGSALLFGTLCIVAFAVIHRRISLPARSLGKTLEQIRAGHVEARVSFSGDDELARVAHTLNTLLDERQAADRAVDQRQRHLESALSELRATRDQLLRAQRVGNIGSWEFDFERNRLDWSEQAFEIFGIEPEAFGGSIEDFLELVHADDREWLQQKRAQWLARGGEFDAEYRIVRPDGEVRWVHACAYTLTESDGKTVRSTGTLQDVTSRRRQELRVRQFQYLIEGSQDLCGTVDDRYRFLWVNQAYADWFGLSPEQVEGRAAAEILGAEHFEAEVKPYLDRCFANQVQRVEIERQHPALGPRQVLVRYYPIDVPGESRRQVGFMLTDVTDLRAAEAELIRRGQLLDMAARVSRFGGWSVDLDKNRIRWSDMTAAIHRMPAGYSPTVEEGIGFYAPEYRDRISKLFSACAERGEPYDEELQIIDSDGQRRWVRTVAEAVRDEHGRIVRVQGAFQDISERKALEVERQRLDDRLSAMFEAMTDGFVAFDEQWRYTYVNAAAAGMIGRSVDELVGASLWQQFPELGGELEAVLRKAMTERSFRAVDAFFEPLDKWLEVRAYPWEEGLAVFFRDMTETHRLLKALQGKEAALRDSRDALDAALNTRQALINSLPAHIALLDNAGNVIDVNEQWRHFGEQNDFEGADFGLNTNYVRLCEQATGECAEEAGAVADGLRAVLAGDRDSFALEYPCHAPDEQRWFRVMFNRLVADRSVPGGVVAMHVDVTERNLAEQQLEKLAFEDPLTGLLSRNGFVRRLQSVLDASEWPAEGIIAMIDVASQRDINDVYGYETGDLLLIELGRRLQARCGDRGLAARAGGDEFVVLLVPNPGSTIEDALNDLGRVVERPLKLAELDVEIDLWIGFTVFGQHRRSPESLIREAELALFEHRAEVGAPLQWVRYTPELDAKTSQRIRLTGELRHAIEAEEFELHFQPKVNLADGSLISAEALIRWHHPERGLQPPGLFIPIAEQSQLIGPIGDWALRDACRQLRDWRRAGLDIVRVSVNVSLVQFALGDFPAKVRAALADCDVAPSALSLEITESVFERHSDDLLTQLRELHALGVKLSLDDFGTGYSSLLYLQRYPFDEIKIDRAFVSHLLDDDYSRNIVRTVIDVAGALGAEVVAEGIESPEITAALLAMGVRIGQGFYYSVPLEAEDFRWLLDKRSRLPLIAHDSST